MEDVLAPATPVPSKRAASASSAIDFLTVARPGLSLNIVPEPLRIGAGEKELPIIAIGGGRAHGSSTGSGVKDGGPIDIKCSSSFALKDGSSIRNSNPLELGSNGSFTSGPKVSAVSAGMTDRLLADGLLLILAIMLTPSKFQYPRLMKGVDYKR